MPGRDWLIELQPTAPMRVGTHPEDIDRARPFAASDTLFGALCWAIRQLFGESELERWLDGVRATPPLVRLSSLLPIIRIGDNAEPLIPLPQRLPSATLPERKWLKQARYVDRAAYHWLVTGEGEAPSLIGEVLVGQLLQRLLTGLEWRPLQLWAPASRPRVTIDRFSGASALYESAVYHFADVDAPISVRHGVYLTVEDDRALERIVLSLELLAEAGLGGERSSGLGRFLLVPPRESPLPLSANPSAGPTLSLCCPAKADFASGALELPAGLGYRLVERSGWVSSPDWAGWRSRSVAMLAEGSYLWGSGPGGTLVDCTPEPGRAHRVYRNGIGLFLEEARL